MILKPERSVRAGCLNLDWIGYRGRRAASVRVHLDIRFAVCELSHADSEEMEEDEIFSLLTSKVDSPAAAIQAGYRLAIDWILRGQDGLVVQEASRRLRRVDGYPPENGDPWE